MPDIRDQSTVDAIAREFTSNGRNKTQAMIIVGYGKGYSDSGAGQESVFGNLRVKQAISKIDAKSAEEMDWNRALNMKALAEQLVHLDAILKDNPNNLVAIQARTAVIRECNASSNQHSNTLHTDAADIPTSLTPEQVEELKVMSKRMSEIKLATSPQLSDTGAKQA